jgi:hypothetical protein
MKMAIFYHQMVPIAMMTTKPMMMMVTVTMMMTKRRSMGQMVMLDVMHWLMVTMLMVVVLLSIVWLLLLMLKPWARIEYFYGYAFGYGVFLSFAPAGVVRTSYGLLPAVRASVGYGQIENRRSVGRKVIQLLERPIVQCPGYQSKSLIQPMAGE